MLLLNHLKRGIAAVLVLIMAALCGCAEKPSDFTGGSPPDTESDTIISESDVSETSEIESDDSVFERLPSGDFGGKTVRTITMNEIWWQLTELSSEELNGEVINDAIYNRNLETENHLNVVLEFEYRNKDMTGEIRNLIMSGDSHFDYIIYKMDCLGKLAQEDLFIDLNKVNSMDMTDKAWDQNANEYFSIFNKLYYGVSDISLGKNEAIWVYMFNKRLLEALNLENPYDLVRNGEWTFEKSYEMMEKGMSDLDGNGKYTETDQYGLATHTVNYYALLIGGGEPLAEKGADGLPLITAGDDKYLAVYDKIANLFGQSKNTLMEWEGKGFMEGRALLCAQVLACVRLFREMDDDFGIIPVPKYDEEQKQHYSYVIPYDVFAAAIPITSKDREMTGTVLQTMAMLSDHYITPAYYDVTIKGKGLRDEDSVEMLDMIRETTVYDLAVMYQWTSFVGGIPGDLERQTEFTSSYGRNKKAVNKAITRMIENFADNKN